MVVPIKIAPGDPRCERPPASLTDLASRDCPMVSPDVSVALKGVKPI
jgi:hypothetical protein